MVANLNLSKDDGPPGTIEAIAAPEPNRRAPFAKGCRTHLCERLWVRNILPQPVREHRTVLNRAEGVLQKLEFGEPLTKGL